MKVDLDQEMKALDRLFHSEADFQHELAWQLHHEYEEAKFRLERRVELSQVPSHLEEFYVDLWIEFNQQQIPVELKYKTSELTGKMGEEKVRLRSHGAHPPNRFDIVADVERVEAVVDSLDSPQGYVVVLTNDPAYWQEPTQDVIDADFRLHDELSGRLTWSDDASQQTKTQKRDRAIELRNDYNLDWKPYSYNRPKRCRGEDKVFRYLLIEVTN